MRCSRSDLCQIVWNAACVHNKKVVQKSHCNKDWKQKLRACLNGGGGPQVGEVKSLGEVTHLSI